ncbi:hypothetical protein JFT91_26235 [Pseudomonas sp. TH08]|uniref:hypothetical protein n=1 Tax=unclassified Pseudomonas TaxID=196821 RepID=UPI001911D3BB|nr:MULTISPECIES: hypothetical protein [unclassified Pseudomonas]MBK5525350.1 hypothetical protein [Pseudomonas sp. TH06]MBK5536037.1 hypothetical protein [Pseudomonas sp. TH08]
MEDRNLKRPISDAVETEKSEEDEFVEVKDHDEWRREALEKERERFKKFEQLNEEIFKSPVRSSSGWVDRLRLALTMLAGVMMGAAMIIAALPSIVRFFEGSVIVAAMAVGSLSLLALVFLLALLSGTRKESFVDLDEKILRRQVEGEELEKAEGVDILRAILKSKKEPPRYYNAVSIEDAVSPNSLSEVDQKLSSQSHEVTGFERHMSSLVRSLDLHINLAENKASLLLDKGTTYLWRGIFFYICSIVVWQVTTSLYEVGKFAVWGMISCSLTFLVVEFLAAWFLRQYKSFTDSSFNLVRVKSVFNRYLLSYLAIKEFSNSGEHLVDMRAQMLKVLEEDVKWLEPAPQKSGDLNHMIAMFESVSGLVEKLKVSAKGDKPAAST